MKFELKIKMDNAAFEDNPEVELAIRLDKIALAVSNNNSNGRVIDSNGNHVGAWIITDQQREVEL